MVRRLTAALAAAMLLTLAAAATARAAIPATITIKSGHKLTPPVIALPNHADLRLTLKDADHRAHTVTVDGRRVHIAAGHAAHLNLQHLTTGHYALRVDGHRRGHLTVGAAGGP
jgi:Cupredoxin-like domain